MTDNDTFIIEMNIARYRAMLQQPNMADEKRSQVERLLAEAKENLKAPRRTLRDRGS